MVSSGSILCFFIFNGLFSLYLRNCLFNGKISFGRANVLVFWLLFLLVFVVLFWDLVVRRTVFVGRFCDFVACFFMLWQLRVFIGNCECFVLFLLVWWWLFVCFGFGLFGGCLFARKQKKNRPLSENWGKLVAYSPCSLCKNTLFWNLGYTHLNFIMWDWFWKRQFIIVYLFLILSMFFLTMFILHFLPRLVVTNLAMCTLACCPHFGPVWWENEYVHVPNHQLVFQNTDIWKRAGNCSWTPNSAPNKVAKIQNTNSDKVNKVLTPPAYRYVHLKQTDPNIQSWKPQSGRSRCDHCWERATCRGEHFPRGWQIS